MQALVAQASVPVSKEPNPPSIDIFTGRDACATGPKNDSEMTSSLSHLRKQIDRLDDRIVALLNRRLRWAEKIGNLKARRGDKVYHPQREQKLLARLSIRRTGLLTRTELRSIYQCILRASRAHQKRVLQQAQKQNRKR